MRILFSVLLLSGLIANSWAEPKNLAEHLSDEPSSSITIKPSQVQQSVTFESLAQLDQLIELGVPELALSLLETEQEKYQLYASDWYTFEFKRIALLSALERWQALIERTQWLLDTAIPGRHITSRIRLWFETQQVMARLQMKQSELALTQLQHMLWDTDVEYRDQSLPALWRRLVIRVYLQLKRDDDARKALVKYEYDYKSSEIDIDWLLLQAQVLLRTDRPQQAVKILKSVPSEDAKALALIAQLQSHPEEAAQINLQMRDLLDGQVLSGSLRWAYSYVAYQACEILADLSSQIVNLESMLSMDMEHPVFDESFQVTADDLWKLYNKQGLLIANDSGLLFGNDEQWLQRSNELLKNTPGKALSLNAALVLQTEKFTARLQQHKIIVEIIERRKNGLELINQLYLHSNYVSNVSVLPDEVRYRLVDYALSEGNYFEAATLMKSLPEPPEGKSSFDWRMRKARVLILQGGYLQSEELIRKTFSEKKSISRLELDRFMQVVFDFQTVQQHQQAIDLFDLISLKGLDETLKREIYFWKAESSFALKQYDSAALFYLKSAHAVSNAGNDLWAQSARFKAGNALIQARIYDDAEKVYKDLLLITDSESRKSLINQNLQKIRLLQSTVRDET